MGGDWERGGKKGISVYPVSSKTLTIMWCLGGKGAKKWGRISDKERILKSMVVKREKKFPLFFNLFSILILFSCSMKSARYGESW